MKKLEVVTILLLFFQLYTERIAAQGIILAYSSTPSICFNDGTLTLNPTGGSAPYNYSIISGPSDPNIIYPLTIPLGQNTFFDLPHGVFILIISDASGQTDTFSVSVGGTYQFPTMTFNTTSLNGIICQESGGLAPFQYAISSTSSSTGFSVYQSSDTFRGMCPGQYWLRVRDSCGNIFTNLVNYSYNIYYNINCVNFSGGTMIVNASGGKPPYTYSYTTSVGSTFTNATGNFSGLPPYFSGFLTITDSCGQSGNTLVTPTSLTLSKVCPYDSNYYCVIPLFDTLTFICTNCTPIQSIRFNGPTVPSVPDVIFRHLALNQQYNIVIIGPPSECGIDTIPYTITGPPSPSLSASFSSCNSFTVMMTCGVADSFVLSYGPGYPTIEANKSGFFYHLPNGTYYVKAFLQGGGNPDTASAYISVPTFSVGLCQEMMMDSICQVTWEICTNPPAPEKYSLIYSPGDTMQYASGCFYYLQSGATYTILSDSGCSVTYQLGNIPSFASNISTTLPCVGPPVIDYYTSFTDYDCSPFFRLKFFYADSIILDTLLTLNIIYYQLTVEDSGIYHYSLYLSPDDTTSTMRFDNICPLDTGSIYVSNSHIPYPYPNFAYECDSNGTDTILYNIYGGSTPYTIQIPGYDTVILTGNSGVFPTHHPGQYTMIVYDNCGISRSITFSVIDTCDGCPIVSLLPLDSLLCAGDTVHLITGTIGAVSFQWLINDQVYSFAKDTDIIPDAGEYNIELRAYSSSGCMDSAVAHFSVISTLSVDLGADTAYCDTVFSRILSTGIASTQWSTGQTGPQITVTAPGQYAAMVSNKCGTYSDTITLASNLVSGLTLTTSLDSICSDEPDTAILYAFIDSLAQSQVTFIWSTGQTSPAAFSASLSIDSGGTYQVIAQRGTCQTAESLMITPVICDSICTHQIAVPDAFTPNGDNKNDSFYVLYSCPVYTFSIHVYDRWGQLVFESTDINEAWDGTFKGIQQPQGTYIWFVCVKETKSGPNTCTEGTLTLMR